MLKTAAIRREIELDEFVIMPNHSHAIITIVECENGLVGATHWVAPTIHNAMWTVKKIIGIINGRLQINRHKTCQ